MIGYISDDRQFYPNHDRVLIKPDNREEKTKGGIIIPKNADVVITKGVVLKTGTSCTFVKENDRVIFGELAGYPIEFDSKNYLVIREADLIAQINEELTFKETKSSVYEEQILTNKKI